MSLPSFDITKSIDRIDSTKDYIERQFTIARWLNKKSES